LNPDIEIVATVIAGDNYVAENLETAATQAALFVDQRRSAVDLVIAGPAFNSGRYGMACAAICQAVESRLGVPTLTGLYTENPAVEVYRKQVTMVRSEADVMGMRDALEAMARVGLKLVSGQPLVVAEDDLIARGVRRNYFAEANGAERAIEMLLAKLNGEAFETEYAMPAFERVPPAPAIADAAQALVALVTSGGIVPKGNPDHIESASASKYGEYSLAGLDRLSADSHQSVHGGYDPTFANADPNRVLPLDEARSLEREGRIGKLFETYYATVGNATSVEQARRFGADIAAKLVNEGVQAVILTST
jgi:glycine reductase